MVSHTAPLHLAYAPAEKAADSGPVVLCRLPSSHFQDVPIKYAREVMGLMKVTREKVMNKGVFVGVRTCTCMCVRARVSESV